MGEIKSWLCCGLFIGTPLVALLFLYIGSLLLSKLLNKVISILWPPQPIGVCTENVEVCGQQPRDTYEGVCEYKYGGCGAKLKVVDPTTGVWIDTEYDKKYVIVKCPKCDKKVDLRLKN